MTDQTSETTPDGLDVAAVRERHRMLPARGGSADIEVLLAALDEAQRELTDARERAGRFAHDANLADDRCDRLEALANKHYARAEKAEAEQAYTYRLARKAHERAEAAEGVVREVRALAEKWEGYAEACRLGMNNSAGETSEPKMLWSVAADRLFDALGDHAAPATTDATEGEA